MATRFILKKLFFLCLTFASVVLLGHVLIVKLLQDIFFVTYLTASAVSGVLFLTMLYIFVNFDEDIERHVNRFLYFRKGHEYKPILEQTMTDELTDLSDYEYFIFRLEQELERAKRYLRPVFLMLIDIDHFTEYNKTYGRSEGDILIVKVSDAVRRFSEKGDIIARHEGGRFAMLLPEADKESAALAAERLRKYVEAMKVKKDKNITLSIGIGFFTSAEFTFGAGIFDPTKAAAFTKGALIKLAKDALDKAKASGGNKVEV